MKITHICLNGPVTDNWSYQDNLLPKYHKKLGCEVSIIASRYIYNNEGKLDIDNKDIYINENGIKVIRINNKFNTNINSKFKRYKGLYKKIIEENPDIIFVHGCQFIDIKDVIKYAKTNKNVKIYVDNHADYSNSATNWISKNILHNIIWRYYANLIEPYTNKFFGVTPGRVEFLKELYKLPKNKIELLIMGADDEKIEFAKSVNSRNNIRSKYNIKEKDFLVITGGKIDNAKKQTLFLIDAVKKIKHDNVKLIIFGSIDDNLKQSVLEKIDNKKVFYAGWISLDDSYNYFSAADLVVFPGRHSVYWEQVAGLGIPMMVKYWEGTTHVDAGGNCEFLYNDSVEEIQKKIENIVADKRLYLNMKQKAEEVKKLFLYSTIAKKSIEKY